MIHKAEELILRNQKPYKFMLIPSNSYPSGVKEYKDYVYVCDANSDSILKFDKKGRLQKIISGNGEEPGFLENPLDLDFDNSGDMYVCDGLNCRIQVFSSEGEFKRIFAYLESHPQCVKIIDDNLLVAIRGKNFIKVYSLKTGSVTEKIYAPVGDIRYFAFSKDRKYIIVIETGGAWLFDNSRSVWKKLSIPKEDYSIFSLKVKTQRKALKMSLHTEILPMNASNFCCVCYLEDIGFVISDYLRAQLHIFNPDGTYSYSVLLGDNLTLGKISSSKNELIVTFPEAQKIGFLKLKG